MTDIAEYMLSEYGQAEPEPANRVYSVIAYTGANLREVLPRLVRNFNAGDTAYSEWAARQIMDKARAALFFSGRKNRAGVALLVRNTETGETGLMDYAEMRAGEWQTRELDEMRARYDAFAQIFKK